MSFSWPQYCDVAEEISNCSANDPLCEAKHRTAISRAYYSVFVPACDYAMANFGAKPKKTSWHKYVIDSLKNAPDPIAQEVGDCLETFKLMRVQVDYKNPAQFDPSVDTTRCIALAKILISKVAEMQAATAITP